MIGIFGAILETGWETCSQLFGLDPENKKMGRQGLEP